MPTTTPPPAVARPRMAVAYWIVAVALYASLGAFFQPFLLLGFWESLPFLFLATWLAGRLFTRADAPASTSPPE